MSIGLSLIKIRKLTEVDNRIDEILNKLEIVKKDFYGYLTKYNRAINAAGMQYFTDELIEYVKGVNYE